MDTLSLCLYGSSFVSIATYSNIAPFYPDEAANRGISTYIVGYIFSAFPVGSLIFSFFVDKFVFQYGRKTILVLGSLGESVGIFLFGFLYLIEDRELFIIGSIILRFIQGISNCFIFSAIYALFASLYPDDLQSQIGINEAVMGIGMMIGPLIGALIYHFGGFFWPFGIFGIIEFSFTILLYIKIDSTKTNQVQANENQERQISFLNVLLNKDLLFSWFAALIPLCTISFYSPIFSVHLQEYGISLTIVGLIFAVAPVCYALSMPLCNYLIALFGKQKTLMTGLIVNIIGVLMIGPVLFPNQLFIVIIGLAVTGIAFSFSIIPLMPVMIEEATLKYPNVSQDDISDISSAILNATFTVSEIIGPPLGGYLTEKYGFAQGCFFFALSQIGYAIVYFIFGVKFCMLKNNKVERKQKNYNDFSLHSSPQDHQNSFQQTQTDQQQQLNL